MAVPALTCRIDWARSGTFGTTAYDTVSPIDTSPLVISRGRSADFGSEAMGSMSFVLHNDDDSYTPDRQWHDNPSFELGTTGWRTAAIASLVAAATSITQVTDNAGQGGTKAGEAVLTGTINSGVNFPIPYVFQNGATYSVSVWLKSISGNLNVRAGMASSGTPADISSSGANITTSWAQYTFTWTPTGDRSDAVFFVRTTTAAVATLRIDAIQLNPGSSLNTYIDAAPTKGQLVPGRPVHVYATYSAVDYPLFYGFIERLTPDPEARLVTFEFYDQLRVMSETDVFVPATTSAYTCREKRLQILGDFERGSRNLCQNPSFETNTSGWSGAGTLTRITTDAAPGAGSACGQWVTTTSSQSLVTEPLIPQVIAGETYRISAYLKLSSGVSFIEMYMNLTGQTVQRQVTLTSNWQRFTITITATASVRYDTGTIQWGFLSDGAGTYLVDGVMITRGEGHYPYSDTGSGRYPSYLANGSFDIGGGLGGWGTAFGNLITNPSFETDTSGWSGTADSFHGLGTITRATTGTQKYGSAHAEVSMTGGGLQGAHFAITGTFTSGVVYAYRAWFYLVSGSAPFVKFGIGSNGTSADKSEVTSSSFTGTYLELTGTWTPSANRTDAHLYFGENNGAVAGTLGVDGFFVSQQSLAASPKYSNVGPGGGTLGVPYSTQTVTTSPVQYGYQSAVYTTPATTGAGTIYDFFTQGCRFKNGQAYTLSLWLRSTTAMPYKVGLGGNKADGTWDEANTSGTLVANTWTQITVTWTPSADRSASAALDVVAYVLQTNATARTFYIDGVRVIPGSSADSYEMSQWVIPATGEHDQLSTAYAVSGETCLGALSALNTQTLGRHWVEATMASPWYTYNVEDRDTYAVKASAEAITVLDGWEVSEYDRSTIINTVRIGWQTGNTEVYSDDTSVGNYGTRPTSDLGGDAVWPGRGAPDLIGAALLARYDNGATRPRMRRINLFPNILQRDLSDLVTITVPRYQIEGAPYTILTSVLTIDAGGLSWTHDVTLESYPY